MQQRVVVGFGDALVASALAGALAEDSGLATSTATSPDEVLQRVAAAQVDAVLAHVDLGAPGGGLELARAVREAAPAVRCLLVVDEPTGALALEVLEAGAVGFVASDVGTRELRGSVEAALRGETCVPRRFLGALMAEVVQVRRRVKAVDERLTALSEREREVLALLGDGLDKDGIARRLVISPQTARTHIQRVMTKLGVHTRVEAAAFAVQHRDSLG